MDSLTIEIRGDHVTTWIGDVEYRAPSKARFDKTAYQKAYMVGWRKRRAEAKKVKSLMDGNK